MLLWKIFKQYTKISYASLQATTALLWYYKRDKGTFPKPRAHHFDRLGDYWKFLPLCWICLLLEVVYNNLKTADQRLSRSRSHEVWSWCQIQWKLVHEINSCSIVYNCTAGRCLQWKSLEKIFKAKISYLHLDKFFALFYPGCGSVDKPPTLLIASALPFSSSTGPDDARASASATLDRVELARGSPL